LSSNGRIGSPDQDQSEQPPADLVVMTHGQISVEMLTDMTSKLARLDEKSTHLGELVKGVEARLLDAVKGIESRLADSVKALDGKVDGVVREQTVTGKTVEGMKDKVEDLVHWKNKIWGMLILAGALIAAGAGLWALVGSHLSWKSGDSAAPVAPPPTAVAPLPPPAANSRV
jgi:hypothetical protein